MTNMPETENSEERNHPLSDTSIGGSESFLARKSYYFIRSLLFGFLYFLLVLALLIMLALLSFGIYVKNCHKQISTQDVKKAHAVKLAGWLAFNDIEKQSPEVRQRLVKKYVSRANSLGKADLNSRVYVKALPYIKRIAKDYSDRRQQKLDEWEAQNKRRPISQTDYKIVDGPGSFINSSEVQPTDSLLERIQEQQDARKKGDTDSQFKESRAESNIRVLAKEWFLRQIELYDREPDDQKAGFLMKFADTLNHFSALYASARAEVGLPPQGDVEQIRDLNYLTSGWLDSTPPEQLAQLLWFKDIAIAVIIAQRAGKSTDAVEQLISRTKSSSESGGILKDLFGNSRASRKDAPKKSSASEPAAESTDGDEPASDSVDFF